MIHVGTKEAEQTIEVPDVIVAGQFVLESVNWRVLASPPEFTVKPLAPV